MNDVDMERRLSDELRRRITPPASAPTALRQRIESLKMLSPVVRIDSRRRRSSIRPLSGLVAAAVAVSLLATLTMWAGSRKAPENAQLPGQIEMFSRIDASSAWAEFGSDLYITRDGGTTWSHSELPGGQSMSEWIASSNSAGPASTPRGTFPGHLYPFFIDADHGWLISWEQVGVSADGTATWQVTVHRTSDGGRTWQATTLPGTYPGPGLARFVDREHGWLEIVPSTGSSSPAGSEPTPEPTATPASLQKITLLATNDGGATWTLAGDAPASTLVNFVTVTEGWGYGQSTGTGMNRISHSVDGGKTWTEASIPVPADCQISSWPETPVQADGGLVFHAACSSFSSSGVVAAPTAAPVETPSPDGSTAPIESTPTQAVLTFASADGGASWTLASREDTNVTWLTTSTSSFAMLTQPSVGQPIAAYPQVNFGSRQPTQFEATFDGGKSWRTYDMTGLPGWVGWGQWASPDDAWVITTSSSAVAGYLYKTTDGGKTWTALLGAPAWPVSATPVPSGTPMPSMPVSLEPGASTRVVGGSSIDQMGMLDSQTGWVVSTGQLFMTADGGKTWSARTLPGWEFGLGYVEFVDADHGWAVIGAGRSDPVGPAALPLTVERTVDGGTTWQTTVVKAPAPQLPGPAAGESASPEASAEAFQSALARVHFRDALHGHVFVDVEASTSDAAVPVARCSRFDTSDGGATWSEAQDSPCLNSTTFEDADLGFATSISPSSVKLAVTRDGGLTWTESASGLIGTPLIVEARPDGSLRALVCSMTFENGSTTMTVLSSSDGGATWTEERKSGGANEFSYLATRLGDGHWLAWLGDPNGPNGRLGETRDGGATWQNVDPKGLLAAQSVTISFSSGTDGWLTLEDFSCGDVTECSSDTPILYATHDGGQTWTPIMRGAVVPNWHGTVIIDP